MNESAIRLLLLVGSPTDARWIRELVHNISAPTYRVHHELNLDAGLTILRREAFDAVLLDLKLPDSAGLETLDRVHSAVSQTPIVVLADAANEPLGREAMAKGAQEYLVKGHFDGQLLSRVIRYVRERKELEREVLETSMHEQQRIGQDLHDSVGQELTGLSFMSQALARKLVAESRPEAESANAIVQGVGRALQAVHDAIRGLAPVELDAHGLAAALERLVRDVRDRLQLDCQFVGGGPVPSLDAEAATHLYRIAQEALHNAAKHADAQRIVLSLRRQDDRLILQVRDDGAGIVGSSGNGKGMGLHIMQYRAEAIGGVLDIGLAAGGGTLVTCSVAYPRNPLPSDESLDSMK